MQGVQANRIFFLQKQRNRQGKIGNQQILQILPETHAAQRSKIKIIAGKATIEGGKLA